MSNPTFKSNRLAELPTRFNDPEGRAWAQALGTVQDDETERLRTAALSRFPHHCPDDALDFVAGWLLIPRLPGEANGDETTGYRGRLCAAWSTWIKAGTQGGIIASLKASGFAGARTLNKHEYDPGAEWWSMFAVRVNGSASGIDHGTWAGGTWGGVDTWGSGTTTTQYIQIVLQILERKWSYAIPEKLVLFFDDGGEVKTPLVNQWGDPDMIWGDFIWGNDPLLP